MTSGSGNGPGSPSVPRAATTVRPAAEADLDWIVALIDRNRGEGLPATERARRGFVQGTWTVDRLREIAGRGGIFLAEVGGIRAGVAFVGPATAAPRPASDAGPGSGPLPQNPAEATAYLAAERFGAGGFAMYGPVVVDDRFRRMGVLATLTDHLIAAIRDDAPALVGFIEIGNDASRRTHRRLGWQEFARFDCGTRHYLAIAHPTR